MHYFQCDHWHTSYERKEEPVKHYIYRVHVTNKDQYRFVVATDFKNAIEKTKHLEVESIEKQQEVIV